jgi:hypothetical protein
MYIIDPSSGRDNVHRFVSSFSVSSSRVFMAERLSTANGRPDLVYGSEGQASSNQASWSFTPALALAEKEKEVLEVPPVAPPEPESRFGELLSARSVQGRRIRRALYASSLVLIVILWTAIVVVFTGNEIGEQKANLNSDITNKKNQGIFSDANVRDIGNAQRNLLRMT